MHILRTNIGHWTPGLQSTGPPTTPFSYVSWASLLEKWQSDGHIFQFLYMIIIYAEWQKLTIEKFVLNFRIQKHVFVSCACADLQRKRLENLKMEVMLMKTWSTSDILLQLV